MDSLGAKADKGKEFLAHYGVKGMRWGQRKSSTPTEVTAETVVNKGLRSNKTKVKAKGGQASPAAEDAVKAAISKQKLKKSGPAALSNKELQDLANRIDLEQRTTRLVSQTSSNPAKRFVAKTLVDTGKTQVQRVANEEASKKVSEVMKKRG